MNVSNKGNYSFTYNSQVAINVTEQRVFAGQIHVLKSMGRAIGLVLEGTYLDLANL